MSRAPSRLTRHQIRRTQDSFYECISVAIYGTTKRSKYIRKALWDTFSEYCFGCNVKELAEYVTASSDLSCVPQGPLHAWQFVGSLAWMKVIIVGSVSDESVVEYQHIFSNVRNQEALARYVIRSSMQNALPDVRIVGQVLCDCFNVGLVSFSAENPKGRPRTFNPHGEALLTDLGKGGMIYIHMIKDGNYWDLLMESTGDKRCVPKHVIHTLIEDEFEDELEGNLGLKSLMLIKPRDSVYQIKVFDGKKRKTSHVGHMISPISPRRVHHLDVDATNVKDWWLFLLYKERVSPVQQYSDKDIWIFAKRGRDAYWISVWKKDLTQPTFLLNVDETAVYAIEADDKETAAACVRNEFSIDVHLTLPSTIE